MDSTCRIAAGVLTLTGGADRVGVRMPDRGQAATHSGPLATTPVNATRANVGTRKPMGGIFSTTPSATGTFTRVR